MPIWKTGQFKYLSMGDDYINYVKFILLNSMYLLKEFSSSACTGMERYPRYVVMW